MLSKQPVEKNLLRQNEDSMILEMLTALVLIGFFLSFTLVTSMPILIVLGNSSTDPL